MIIPRSIVIVAVLALGVTAIVLQANAQTGLISGPTTVANSTATNTANTVANFNSTGKITSVIFPAANPSNPNATKVPYLLGGTFNLDISKGKVSLFNASFLMALSNGTDKHTHTFINFRPSNATIAFNTTGTTLLNGTMDITKNGAIAWRNVTTGIAIENSTIVRIHIDDGQTNNHFIGQPVYGIIDSPSTTQTSTASIANTSKPATTVTSSSNETIIVKGTGFTRDSQVTSTINGDMTTAQSSQVAPDGTFSSTIKLQSNDTAGKTLQIITTEQPGGTSVSSSFVVP